MASRAGAAARCSRRAPLHDRSTGRMTAPLHPNMADPGVVRGSSERTDHDPGGPGLPLAHRADCVDSHRRRVADRAARRSGGHPAVCGRQENPEVLAEIGVMDDQLSRGAERAGKRHGRRLRNGVQNAKTSAAEALEVPQELLVAGACSTRSLRNGKTSADTRTFRRSRRLLEARSYRFSRLVERPIPRLTA